MSGVWKAPATARRTCPAARRLRQSLHGRRRPLASPETTMLPGTEQVGDLQRARAARPARTVPRPAACSRPRTLTMPLGVASAAACMASPRRCTRRRPSREAQRPGKHQGGVLAQAQPGRRRAGGHGGGLAGSQRFQGGQAGDEDGRLADDGGVEPFRRAVAADVERGRSRGCRPPRRTARRAAGQRLAQLPGPCRRPGRPGRERGRRLAAWRSSSAGEPGA